MVDIWKVVRREITAIAMNMKKLATKVKRVWREGIVNSITSAIFF
jgi:hypothetical protein